MGKTKDKTKDILSYIALGYTLFCFAERILRISADKSQDPDCFLLGAMAVLVALELREPHGYFRIRPIYAVAVIIFSIGVSLLGRSIPEATERILGGLVGFALFFVIHKISFVHYKEYGFDQGTLVCATIAGLFLGFDRILALVFVMPWLAFLFYVPLWVTRKLPYEGRVPILPFLVVASIFLKSPYSQYMWIKCVNMQNKTKIQAIEKYLASERPMIHYSEDKSVRIAIDYDREPNSIDKIIKIYAAKSSRPFLKYVSSVLSSEKHFFRDADAKLDFTVAPVYYIVRCYKWESTGAKLLRVTWSIGKIVFLVAFFCFIVCCFKRIRLNDMAFLIGGAVVVAITFFVYSERWKAQSEQALLEDARSLHALKLKAIEKFLHEGYKIDFPVESCNVHVVIEYNQDKALYEDVKKIYQARTPQLVLLSGSTMRGDCRLKDMKTGCIFDVKPVYYVHALNIIDQGH